MDSLTFVTSCLLGNFACCFSAADLFQNQLFQKNSFRNTIRVSNILDPDQARRFVRPDLDPNCLQKLSADDPSRQRVKASSNCNDGSSNQPTVALISSVTGPSISITGRYYVGFRVIHKHLPISVPV